MMRVRVELLCRRILGRALTGSVILLIGCSSDGIQTPDQPGPVASVELIVDSPTILWTRATRVVAIPRDAFGRLVNNANAATWASSHPDRVLITPNANVTGALPGMGASASALGVGEATITATVDGRTASAKILAYVTPETPLKLLPDTSRIPVSAQRVLRMQPIAGLNRPPYGISGVVWESSDPSLVTVDDAGAITALGEGQATVTALFPNDVRFTAKVFVDRYPSPLTFTSVTTGDRHACGLTSTGVAYCWGDNESNQLGVDAAMDRCGTFLTAGGGIIPSLTRWFRCSEAPVAVNTPLRFTSISAGGRQTCALTAAGAVYCWGRNVDGTLGTGVADTIVRTPTRVGGGVTFRSIDVGTAGQICGISTSNAAYCWGNNSFGSLGDGSREHRATPTAVAGGHSWRQVRAGPTTCGLTTDDIAYCWGANSRGEAGVPAGTETRSPARVAGDLRFKQLGARCGLVADGSAYCWGQIWGGVVTHTPTLVSGGLSFGSLSRGSRCGVAVDGAYYCWSEPLGQAAPVRTPPNFAIRAIDVGGGIACAIDVAGTAYCWGNAHGVFWRVDVPNVSGDPRRVLGQQ